MFSKHETGVVQPVEEVARVCREAGVLLHDPHTARRVRRQFERLAETGALRSISVPKGGT